MLFAVSPRLHNNMEQYVGPFFFLVDRGLFISEHFYFSMTDSHLRVFLIAVSKEIQASSFVMSGVSKPMLTVSEAGAKFSNIR